MADDPRTGLPANSSTPAGDVPVLERGRRDDIDLASYVDDALFGGPGVALLRGMSDDPLWTDEPSALLSFAKRIGSLLPQNEAGDLVDQITFTSGSHVRGAKTRRELPFHTDLGPCVPDVFLLYCVHQAPRGGGTIVVDGLRVPEWLDDEALTVLTSPFPFDVSDNAVDSSDAVMWRPVLVRDKAARRVDVTYNRARIHRGYRALGLHPPAERVKAMDALDAALANPEAQSQLRLRNGDLLCVNNHRFLHARGQFSDDTDENRLLLRVWLAVDPDGSAVR